MARPAVAIIGASTQRHKFGNKAVRAFLKAGFDVYPIHPDAETVEGRAAYPSLDALPVDRLDGVSLYVPPEIGLDYLDQVARKHVEVLWINPGADSQELLERAKHLGLKAVATCSILAIGQRPNDF